MGCGGSVAKVIGVEGLLAGVRSFGIGAWIGIAGGTVVH